MKKNGVELIIPRKPTLQKISYVTNLNVLTTCKKWTATDLSHAEHF